MDRRRKEVRQGGREGHGRKEGRGGRKRGREAEGGRKGGGARREDWREGGREGGREGWEQGMREVGRDEGVRQRGSEAAREGGSEGTKQCDAYGLSLIGNKTDALFRPSTPPPPPNKWLVLIAGIPYLMGKTSGLSRRGTHTCQVSRHVRAGTEAQTGTNRDRSRCLWR